MRTREELERACGFIRAALVVDAADCHDQLRQQPHPFAEEVRLRTTGRK